MFKNYDLIVVGAGLFGSVVAEQASRAGHRVCVIEQRGHIGGNCYTEIDSETDIIVHRYGPHIFHTNDDKIWEYINQFTKFNNYVHKAKSLVNNTLFTFPINLDTFCRFNNVNYKPAQMATWIEEHRSKIDDPKNFEEQALSILGYNFYHQFIRGYTTKQWGVDPTHLPASVARRLPFRTNYNDRYYNDRYEGIPVDGYTPIFQRMLDHPNITVKLNTDWNTVRDQVGDQLVVYTGAIDRYYDYQLGHLNWRTLDFEFNLELADDYNGVTQVNYPGMEVAWTREIEHKHFHPERKTKPGLTIVSREYSRLAAGDDIPYYPVKTEQDQLIYDQYRDRADTETNVIFGGRLGEYMYYDMHQVIGSALACYKNKIVSKLAK
jgi:UDP-galactopyranose mutase